MRRFTGVVVGAIALVGASLAVEQPAGAARPGGDAVETFITLTSSQNPAALGDAVTFTGPSDFSGV